MGFTPFGPRTAAAEAQLLVLYGRASECRPAPPSTTAAPAASPASPGLPKDSSTRLLTELGISFKHFAHPPAPTIADWRPHATQHAPEARMCKNLFLKNRKKDRLVLVVALAETKIDLGWFGKFMKLKNPRLSTEAMLMEALGLQKGAVTPLAMLADVGKRVELVLGKGMMSLGRTTPMLYHPMSGNESSIAVLSTDLERYLAHVGHTARVLDFEAQTEASWPCAIMTE